MLSINTNSIAAQYRRYNLLDTIKKYNPDITLINETKLNKNHKLAFKDYNMIRNDRESAWNGGGTAILIRKNIIFEIINIKKLKLIETSIIKLKLNNTQNLFIICAYAPPGSHNKFTSDLNTIFTNLKLNNTDNWYILAGDLNAKHSDWKNMIDNKRGKELKVRIEDNSIECRTKLLSSDQPTYKESNSYIDLIMSDARLIYKDLINGKIKMIPYDSDHNGILWTVSLDVTQENCINSQQQSHFNFNKAKWKKIHT